MNNKPGFIDSVEQFYTEAKRNKWFVYFTVFCRVALALGFIPSGIVKISGERFTALPSNHPLGHYFDALHQTGYYYTFIGVAQLVTALLLLIPKTALIGAVFYFPFILNICVLAYSTRFEGTRITTLMLLANLYLLSWDYNKLKFLVATKSSYIEYDTDKKKALNNKFPLTFFSCVFLSIAAVIVINIFIYEIRPGNSFEECGNARKYPKASVAFCDCIYNKGKSLDSCLEVYKMEKEIEKNYNRPTTNAK